VTTLFEEPYLLNRPKSARFLDMSFKSFVQDVEPDLQGKGVKKNGIVRYRVGDLIRWCEENKVNPKGSVV
jgi:hypothetical protein